MRTIRVPIHCRDHVGSEYVSYAVVDHKVAEFINNKHSNEFTHIQTVNFIY